ncbi:hypothetical protein D3C77_226680 [compost metagenome]
MAVRLQLLRLDRGLPEVLQHVIEAYVFAPTALVVPLLKGLLPFLLIRQMSPLAFESRLGGSDGAGRGQVHHAFLAERHQLLASLDLIKGFQQGVQVVGIGLALDRVFDPFGYEGFGIEAAQVLYGESTLQVGLVQARKLVLLHEPTRQVHAQVIDQRQRIIQGDEQRGVLFRN